MKRITSCLLSGAIVLCAGLSLAVAQSSSEGAETTPPPKVLLIDREFLKPGKAGSVHEKAESAFVQAFARAKSPTHYFAATSVSGRPRALFFIAYDSFEAWEKDNQSVQKNPALAAALDHALLTDGELLSDMDATLVAYNEEQSMRPNVDIAHMRYFEILVFRVRPGHRHDWEELVKLVKTGYDKIPSMHWATFESIYGQQSGTYLIFQALKSAAEIDQGFEHDKEFADALGEDGLKRLDELESAAIEFRQTNLFQFSPSMSYPRDEWVKEDPEFWKPKAASPKKMQAKPAEKQ
jgi:hypothetical protein